LTSFKSHTIIYKFLRVHYTDISWVFLLKSGGVKSELLLEKFICSMTLMHYGSAIHTIDQLTVHNITILSNPYKIVDDSCYTFIRLTGATIVCCRV